MINFALDFRSNCFFYNTLTNIKPIQMKKVILAMVCFISWPLLAQDAPADSVKHWTVGGTSSFTFNQVSLTNWSAGGKNSLAGTFLVNTYLNYKKEKVNWDNVIDVGYGLTKQGSDNSIKTEDKLNLASKFGYSAGRSWFYSALLDFKTQMDVGYNDPPENTDKLSEFMSPAYLNFSFGMDYKPSDQFSLYLSPLTSKTTIVLDDSLSNEGAFGVKKGENFREEYGASVKMTARKKDLVKNVDFTTRLDLFSSLTNNPQNIDMDWEMAFNMKVNAHLTTILSFHAIYDDDIKYKNKEGIDEGPRLQFKQLFGFGINYKFGK